MLPMQNLINVFKRSIREYGQDEVSNLAAALAFAAFFSIFPLILFLVSLATFIFTPQQAQDLVLRNLPNLQTRGEDANFFVKTVTDVIKAKGAGTGIAAVVGLVSLLLSASGVFGTLETAINRAWDCNKAGSLIKDKVIAFLMVLGVAAVLFVSTAISSILNGLQQGTNGIIGQMPWLWNIVNLLVSTVLMAGVLTVIFRTLPRCKVNWSDVWPGALLTSILFQVLQQLFAFYLGHFANYQAVYGALGGIIALQTYIFFFSQVLLFGAEFCSEYAGERMDMEAARATKATEERARQRRADDTRRAEDLGARDAERTRAREARKSRVAPVGSAPPRDTATVFAAAAGIAALVGAIGKVLTRGGARR